MYFPRACVCLSFCTDISKKTPKYVPHWPGNATSNSTWGPNSWNSLEQRQERKWAKIDFFSGNHSFSSNIWSKLWVIPAVILPHLLFSSLSSDPSPLILPHLSYLHFICYQLYKFSLPCVHLETRSMSFSSVAESPAQHLAENLLGGAGRGSEISE